MPLNPTNQSLISISMYCRFHMLPVHRVLDFVTVLGKMQPNLLEAVRKYQTIDGYRRFNNFDRQWIIYHVSLGLYPPSHLFLLLKSRTLVYQGPIDKFGDRNHGFKQPFDNTSDTRYSCFVQQWLYFGLLTDFFEIWDLHVSQSDFIVDQDGSKKITNRLLADYFVACTAQEFNQNQSLLRDKRPTNTNANYTKSQKKAAIDRMDKSLELFKYVQKVLQAAVVSAGVDPAIWDSVILTTALLIRFWQILNGSIRPETVTILTPDLSRFHFRSIADLRTNRQFCVHEQKLLLDLVDHRANDIAFFSLLGPNQDGKSHSECKKNECNAYQIEEGEQYRTVHTSSCDGTCNFLGLDSDFWTLRMQARAAEETQQEGYTQMLYEYMVPESFTKTATAVTYADNKLTTQDVSLWRSKTAGWSGSHTMVAFSHVWADGLGNPGSNSLPTCQLERLQDLANSAYPKLGRNVAFWFDTLLIPVRDNLASMSDDQQEEVKTSALRDMEWVYKCASKVLVLDKRLFEVDSTNMGPEEIGARIMCSVWSRRLWTLQEGCIKAKTIFKFQDKWMNWTHLHDEVLDRGGLSNWKRKASKLDKHHPIVKAKNQDIKTVVNKKGNRMDVFEGAAGEGISLPIVEAWTAADKRLYKVTSQNWHSIYRFLEELTIDWSGSARAAVLPRCIRGMYYRNCSRQEDESLVLASMIAETPGLAAKLTSDCKGNAQRYEYLMKQMKEVPEDLLFLDQLRYDSDGHRWIPRTLLGASAANYLPPYRSDTLPSRHIVQTPSVRRRISTLCKRREDGIEVGLPGLKLMSGPQGIKAPFRFRCWDSNFEVTLKYPGEPPKRPLEPNEELSRPLKHAGQYISSIEPSEHQHVLIFDRAASIATDWTSVRAALISMTEWFGGFRAEMRYSAGGKGNFRALATVTRLETDHFEASDLPLVEVEEPRTKMHKWVRPLENSDRSGPLQRWIVG